MPELSSGSADEKLLTGAEAVLAVLNAAGVRDVFGLASGKLSPLFHALAASEGFTYTGVRHEAAAAFMAASVYAASGRLAVGLGETGPGGLNLMSGLGGAWANNLAVLAITSSNPSSIMAPARGAFSSTDNERVFAPLTKWNTTARHGERIPELVHRAVRVALSGRPGPVHLDIPAEVLRGTFTYARAELEAEPSSYRALEPAAPAPSAIAAAAALLRGARRPVLVAGGGTVRAGAASAFRDLAERLQAPAVTTQMGLGAIPAEHPLCVGQGGFIGGPAVVRAMREADVMLAVGCRFSSFMWTQGPPLWTDAPRRRMIQVDIDPESIGQIAPVAVGLASDARVTLESLLIAVGGAGDVDADWLQSLRDERATYRAALEAAARAPAARMHPAALARAVGAFIGPDDFVTFDGGHTSFWSNEFTPASTPGTRFHEPGMSHLGFGLPAAIALARTYPDRRSFCLTGDGAFGFTLQELDTARRYGANVVTVIHNNEAWGVIRAGQQARRFELGVDLSGVDYAQIARGFGCHGERVETVEEVAPALRRAVESGSPAVIDARVSFTPHPMFPMFGASTSVR